MSLFKKKQSNIPRRRATDDGDRSHIETKTPQMVFKRNRTLTGTKSNNFRSAANVKSDFESPRVHVHHLTRQRRIVFNALLIVLLSVALIFLLLNNFTASAAIGLSDTSISKPVDNNLYEKAIQEYLDINPMNRFHFALDQSALSAYVSSKLPEVASVEQKNSVGPGVTRFAITMRKPVAGWRIENKQYYVDSMGISFEQNYFSAPEVLIVDNSGASLEKGTAIASKRFLSFVGRVVALSKASGYTVNQATLPIDTTRQLEIKLKEVDYIVKLSIDRPAGEQVEDMARSIKYLAVQGKALSYIDVRVSGKAFYK